MKRILIRSGKSPFHKATAEQVIHQDLIGTNTGNLLFSDAAHKALLTDDTEVTSNGIKTDISAKKAAEVNERYDVFVVPLANAFRPSFEVSLNRLSTLIEQLTIPVVVLGVGAQTGADYSTERLAPIADSVKRFMRAVLARSASVGVRGELTKKYLGELGFSEVDIIGCPSMFLNGDSFPIERRTEKLTPDSRVAINISHDAAPVGEIGAMAHHASATYPGLRYFAQNLTDAELLFWGDTSEARGAAAAAMPDRRNHPLLRENKVSLPLDPWSWISELRGYDFAYGTRIHGNIAALLAGTPSVVLCHDSRTLELCRYFDIPFRMLPDLPGDTDPAVLYEEADFTGLVSGHAERFQRFIAFLDKHGLENTWTHGDGGASFDAAMNALPLPPSLEVWDGSDDGALGYRIARLHERANEGGRTMAAANRRIEDLTRRNAELERRTAALEKRLNGIEKRVAVRMGPAIRRRARKLLGK